MQIPNTLTLVTGNPDKLAEIRRLVRSSSGRDSGAGALPRLDSVALDLPEIQSLDLEEVLRAKGEEARRRVDGPLVVEETGLEVEAFGGFPGPLVKWMLRAMGAGDIARAARALSAEGEGGAPRAAATARCLLLYVDGERRVIGEGAEPGELVFPPRGDRGFGWDPIFLPEGETRTYAELPGEIKDEIGHRGKAWRDLMRRLGTIRRQSGDN